MWGSAYAYGTDGKPISALYRGENKNININRIKIETTVYTIYN